jgi:hypothetical protein
MSLMVSAGGLTSLLAFIALALEAPGTAMALLAVAGWLASHG